jgi:hypothetical protein
MRTFLRGKITLLFMTFGLLLAIPAVALADNINDDIADDTTTPLSLVKGDANSKPTAEVQVVGNASGGDTDPGCNFDTATETVTISFNTPTGVTATALDGSTATAGQMKFTTCLTKQTVQFQASNAATAGNYVVTANIVTNTSGGSFNNNVNIPITVSNPPDDVAPTVTASAVKGDAPDFTGATAYTADTWTNKDVKVTFTCADNDGGSGLTAASGNQVKTFTTNTSVSGTTASFDGTCVDNAGNTAAASNLGPIKIDKTNPLVSLNGGPADGQSYYFGSVPDVPTCDASDALSGLDGACSVSGYSSAVGTHTVKATATDMAGNTNTASSTYTVKPYTLNGFYQPIDMNDTVNTVKNGSTVPVKFEIFAGSELTSTSAVTSILARPMSCGALTGEPEDPIETLATGGTSLRYDATAGQFIYNWTTPKGASQVGKCYSLTMTAADSFSSITAYFKLK